MKESRITARMMFMMKKDSTITMRTMKMAAKTGLVTFIKLYIVRALQRAMSLVDSKVEANKKAFKEVFLYLKSISKHKKKSRLYSLAYEIC